MFESRKGLTSRFFGFRCHESTFLNDLSLALLKVILKAAFDQSQWLLLAKKGKTISKLIGWIAAPRPTVIVANTGLYVYIYIYVGIPKPSKIFQKFCWFLGAKTCGKGGEGLRLLSSPFSNLEFSFLDGNAVGVLHGLVAACKAPPTMPFENTPFGTNRKGKKHRNCNRYSRYICIETYIIHVLYIYIYLHALHPPTLVFQVIGAFFQAIAFVLPQALSTVHPSHKKMKH